MNRTIIAATLALWVAQAHAGQFDQLHQIEVQQQQADAYQQATQQRQWQDQQAQAQAREDANRRARAAAQARSAEQAAEQRKSVAQENSRLRSRAEQQADEEHSLDIEERKLKLQAMKAKADRSNDYIDAELRSSAAQTDVVQSRADATRDVSSGTKTLLEDTGKADVNRSDKLFGN
ncbi:DUF5384 family protein [Pseudomonas sp. NA-150]|uniref:DUF5384 family protein n=1 Tax=Pseudomonas sp. NA-150 TaxID=3367525 RepID=UPI0037CC3F68